MLEPVPNRATPPTIRRGDSGWPVFAVQDALHTLGMALSVDGVFGPTTDGMLKAFQKSTKLVADGIAGPSTQDELAGHVEAVVAGRHPGLPVGLMRGLADLESGGYLGAVNWTVAGGVDCGVVQRRVFGPPYDASALRRAYGPASAMATTAGDLEDRFERARDLGRGVERSWRLAALAHNWPWAADQLARFNALPNPSGVAGWVAPGIRFPDGATVRTRMEWCEFYALGGRHGEGRACRFVRDWT